MAELRNPASEELNDGHIEVTWDFKHNTEQYVPRTHARISSWRAGTGYSCTGYLATYMCGGTRVRGWRVRRVAMGAGTRHGRADCRPGGRAAGCPGSGVRRLITLCSLELGYHVK